MTKYEKFSYVNTKEQAQDIKERLQSYGYKSYYDLVWIVYREVKE